MSRHLRFIGYLAWLGLFLFGPDLAIAQYGPPPRDQGFAVFYSDGVRIEPGRALLYNFYVATYLRRARLAGNIVAQGGSGNDILVQVWRNQRKLFDSGQRRSVVLSIPIVEPGEYSLVLSNAFSVLSPKVASGYVNLLYDGIDSERAQVERQNTERRTRIANDIMDRLYARLKADEREWATFQVPYKPRVVVSSNEELNASAFVQANTIVMNRGTFELAESYADQTADILAGVIGHELAHIFYKHPRGNPTGLSLWDELVGVLPIDRAQEREADILGARLACQGGFNPGGLIVFLEGFAAGYGNRTNFGSTHPQSSERIRDLKPEVAKCVYRGNQARVESERSAENPPQGRVELPSSRYRTYSEFGLLTVSIPDNWRELPGNSSVWFAPEGGYGQVNGQPIFTYGVRFGRMQAQQRNLQHATQDLVNGLTQKNRNLQPRSGYQRIYVAGRNGLSISLTNINEATGEREVVIFLTTQLRNDDLFLAIFVTPESEYANYKNTFSAILRSIQLSG